MLNEDFSPKITKKRRFEGASSLLFVDQFLVYFVRLLICSETQNGDEEDGNNRKRTKYEVKEWPDFSCIIC